MLVEIGNVEDEDLRRRERDVHLAPDQLEVDEMLRNGDDLGTLHPELLPSSHQTQGTFDEQVVHLGRHGGQHLLVGTQIGDGHGYLETELGLRPLQSHCSGEPHLAVPEREVVIHPVVVLPQLGARMLHQLGHPGPVARGGEQGIGGDLQAGWEGEVRVGRRTILHDGGLGEPGDN